MILIGSLSLKNNLSYRWNINLSHKYRKKWKLSLIMSQKQRLISSYKRRAYQHKSRRYQYHHLVLLQRNSVRMNLYRADSDRCLKFRLMQLKIWIGNSQHSTNMKGNAARVSVDPLYNPKVSITAWQNVILEGTTQLEHYMENLRMSISDFSLQMSSRCHRILTQRSKIIPIKSSSSIPKWPEDCPSYQEILL